MWNNCIVYLIEMVDVLVIRGERTQFVVKGLRPILRALQADQTAEGKPCSKQKPAVRRTKGFWLEQGFPEAVWPACNARKIGLKPDYDIALH